MAVANSQKIASDGTTSRMVVYRVFGVNAGDTINCAGEFSKVSQAYFIPTTGAVAPAAATISGNTSAAPAGALALDDGYLIAYGSGLQQ